MLRCGGAGLGRRSMSRARPVSAAGSRFGARKCRRGDGHRAPSGDTGGRGEEGSWVARRRASKGEGEQPRRRRETTAPSRHRGGGAGAGGGRREELQLPWCLSAGEPQPFWEGGRENYIPQRAPARRRGAGRCPGPWRGGAEAARRGRAGGARRRGCSR